MLLKALNLLQERVEYTLKNTKLLCPKNLPFDTVSWILEIIKAIMRIKKDLGIWDETQPSEEELICGLIKVKNLNAKETVKQSWLFVLYLTLSYKNQIILLKRVTCCGMFRHASRDQSISTFSIRLMFLVVLQDFEFILPVPVCRYPNTGCSFYRPYFVKTL